MAYNFIRELKHIRSQLLLSIAQSSELDSFLNEDPIIMNKRKFHYDILKILEKSEKLMMNDEE